jgi:multidrug efflux pump subunit AcrB
VRLELPFGAPVEDTRAVKARAERAARQALEALGGERHLRGLFSQVGAATLSGGRGFRPETGSGPHVAEVAVHLVPAGQRPFGAEEFSRQWRQRLGEFPDVERLSFDFDTASSGEAPIAFDLRHSDPEVLEVAAARLARHLGTYAGVFDVNDGFTEGKEQLDLTLTQEGRSLGLTAADVAGQVRSAFFGAEALRQQRGRDEVRVYVRLPESQRRSEQDVERLILRIPQGGEVPLTVAANVERGRSYAELLRRDGFRIAPVTADVDPAVTNANEVTARIVQQVLPELQQDFPGLTWRLGGEQREQREAMGSLGQLFLLALLAIYALLAVALRSYVQPLIILSAVPFGMVGAVLGHVLMGYDLSLMSMMGVVALSGVVVNDSLLLVVTLNSLRQEKGLHHLEAVVAAGTRRFRPILLTTLTTFFGLSPLILETSMQARFLIPMALSLGFGILFATFITLMLVPALYMMVEDAKRGMGAVRQAWKPQEPGPTGSTPRPEYP